MAFTEDLDLFLETDDFASVLTLFPGEAGEVAINGIFDREYFAAEVGSEVDVVSAQPMIRCRDVDVSAVVQGSGVKVGSVDYHVVDIQPDGTGITDLILHEGTS